MVADGRHDGALISSTSSQPGRRPAGLAVFDFDGTLRPGDSLLPFLSLIAGRGTVIAAIARSTARLALGRRRADRNAIKDVAFVRLLAGRASAEFERSGRSFGLRLIGDLRSDVVARLRHHQQLGHDVVIVSASLSVYLTPVAEYLGCQLSATELVVDPAGMLTGRIRGTNCRGPEKVERLEALYPNRAGTVWAYGDSRGDDEMLAWSDHGVRIGARKINGPL